MTLIAATPFGNYILAHLIPLVLRSEKEGNRISNSYRRFVTWVCTYCTHPSRRPSWRNAPAIKT